jgi:hypothetical protein
MHPQIIKGSWQAAPGDCAVWAQHQQNDELVYNEADIDGARVVWAREMDPLQTSRLIEYFKDREVWLAEINDDDIRQKLVPYPIAVGR